MNPILKNATDMVKEHWVNLDETHMMVTIHVAGTVIKSAMRSGKSRVEIPYVNHGSTNLSPFIINNRMKPKLDKMLLDLGYNVHEENDKTYVSWAHILQE